MTKDEIEKLKSIAKVFMLEHDLLKISEFTETVMIKKLDRAVEYTHCVFDRKIDEINWDLIENRLNIIRVKSFSINQLKDKHPDNMVTDMVDELLTDFSERELKTVDRTGNIKHLSVVQCIHRIHIELTTKLMFFFYKHPKLNIKTTGSYCDTTRKWLVGTLSYNDGDSVRSLTLDEYAYKSYYEDILDNTIHEVDFKTKKLK
ncbi:hypothetical protein KMW28_27325 [Flammeovirga yaeyamensis]|uniref:Phage protein n=1 Tax=Flammeovirga yaeyamensis TaxID=367791 RepID=A0AAX1NF24_9BACT|nr:hypothetical protein [Flammeovirga yaeyamensis]MBB3700006.1 hypothetical protein [Flammeovirga yaeyamensis]NMF37556.1 hypothetical protein [Flammeovirga yaeyamensis]QWG04613.1 hypothetical protein KMW28_27325 [Flammeovirga yaeyamensis]